MTFSYAISGLSADRLRVLLHPVNLDTDPDTPNFNNDVVTHIYNIYYINMYNIYYNNILIFILPGAGHPD